MKKTIINILTTQLQNMLNSLAELETIKAFLANFDGKRIKTLEKNMPEGMSLQIEKSDIYISLSNSNKSHLIGYTTDPQKLVDISEFESLHSGYIAGAAQETEKIKAILNNPEKLDALVHACTKLEKAYNKLKNLCIEITDGEFNSSFPAYYDILRTIGISSNLMLNLQYNRPLPLAKPHL